MTNKDQMSTVNLQGKVLITGAAGFIGFHLAQRLLHSGKLVVGLDNLNDYYDVSLKKARLRQLTVNPNFVFAHGDLKNAEAVNDLFLVHRIEAVVHLAAQAGVRYSINNPGAYIDSNIIGFFNILEACRHHPVKHLVYASSSSVYGMQKKTPFSIADSVDKPISLYAATKKSNELMAYSYSHLYQIPVTGLRFFTVYGPWGRPDMAYFSFTEKIRKGQRIQVFNHGNMLRDFTYIDDVVRGILGVLEKIPNDDVPSALYNIGNNQPENLLYFIQTLEECLMHEGIIEKPSKKEFLPMQPGDVYQTYADIEDIKQAVGFLPTTSIKDGLAAFAAWYRQYYIQDAWKA